MEWFIAVIAIVTLGIAAMAAAGGVGEMTREPVYDTYRQDLPTRPLTAQDLQAIRFGVTLRGYAMSQVDDLIERLGREITERDARIAELSGLYPPGEQYQRTERVEGTERVESTERSREGRVEGKGWQEGEGPFEVEQFPHEEQLQHEERA